ncbi:DUF4365 domain-containing protein [Salinibacterium sp.]|uniref:DUF4365 domain-containing protein n=1 Tax=Salinibacterium sp. TaxID=1915057 RepID=UPI00286C3F56|nr:DUF4365 domain-containing protein [Salinibacterium sp.]
MTNAAASPSASVATVDFLAEPLLNLAQRKARYGVTYLRALASQAGCTFDETASGEDVQAVDAKIGFGDGDVFVQVKTTKRHKMSGTSLTMNYTPTANWLRKWGKLRVPVYFVVVVVPSDSGVWLDHHVAGTHMFETAAYWCRIDVAAVTAANKIEVPRAQRLSAATLPTWESDLRAIYGGGV